MNRIEKAQRLYVYVQYYQNDYFNLYDMIEKLVMLVKDLNAIQDSASLQEG